MTDHELRKRSSVPLVVGIGTLFLAGLTTAVTPVGAAAQDERVRVAVVDFANNSTFTFWGPRLGEAAANQLAGALLRSGEFTVIERSQLDAVLAEQSLGQTGGITRETATKLGELLGVQAILTGAVTQFSIENNKIGIGPASIQVTEAESILDARLVDTNTGEILLAVEGSGKKRLGNASVEDVGIEQDFDAGVAQEALRPAVDDAVAKILESKESLASLGPPPAPPGMVVGLNDASIYIDRGQEHGVEAGQRYEVFRVKDEIRSAEGELLDRITEKVGVLEVTRVLSKSSVCRLVEGDALDGDEIRAQG